MMWWWGLLWAALAPLGLVAIALAVAQVPRRLRAFERMGWSPRASTLAERSCGLSVVALVALPIWWLDYTEFKSVCAGAAQRVIHSKVKVEGFYLADPTANSFGMRYLYDEGFGWFETADYRQSGAWVRFQRASDGAIEAVSIPAVTALHEVNAVHSDPFTHSHLEATVVSERATGRVLSSAGMADFSGGRLRPVLGGWGTASCPSAMSEPESWGRAYHLARDTLR